MADAARTHDTPHHGAAGGGGGASSGGGASAGNAYARFFAMVGTSTALMFVLMYLNTYAIEHVLWSETRFYMVFVMGATMAAVMLAFMLGMYRNTGVNIAIFIGSAVVFAVALWLVRSQETVQDRSFMQAMIPHHSIAIMTSSRAELSDPRVQALAGAIVDAQNREIAEMKFLLHDIERNGDAGPEWPLGDTGPARIQTLAEALATPEIAVVRPAPLSRADIRAGLGTDAACSFRRTVTADPIFVTGGEGQAIAKVSGSLIPFQGSADAGLFTTEGASFALSTEGGEDIMVFELDTGPGLRVGFMGYWSCAS